MSRSSRGQRLAHRPVHRLTRRYPLLASVPEEERPGIVRAALRHPLLLLPLLALAIGLLPLYFQYVFALLGVETEPNQLLKMAKLGGAVLLPVCLAVPLLSRLVVPRFIRKEMRKRGYALPAEPPQGSSSPRP